MIIIKTEKNIGVYLQEAKDGKPLRGINSMDELNKLSYDDYEIIKGDDIKPIKDLDKAKEQYR